MSHLCYNPQPRFREWYQLKKDAAADMRQAHASSAFRQSLPVTLTSFANKTGDIGMRVFPMLLIPFNIASYALLTMMVAQVTGLKAGEFIHTLGDAHLYLNHMEQTLTQLKREPRALPVMKINPDVTDLFSFKYEDFELTGYDPHPAIKAPVAV
jgi:hypothetical protein